MPSQKLLKRLAPVAVILGFLGLLVAAVVWLLQRQFDSTVKIALAFGVLGLAVAALLDPETVLQWLRGRQVRYGSNVALMTVAFAGILLILNYLAVNGPLPAEWKRKDLTQDQANTLSSETLTAIKAVPAPVRVVGFFSTSAASQRDSAKRLLDQYQTASNGKITYEFHDPLGEPTLANSYGITQDGTLIMVMEKEKQQPAYVAETEITAALIRLTNPTSHVIYFLTSHGERDINSSTDDGLGTSVGLLKQQNYEARTLNLQVTNTVPADARELVVAGALTPVTASEVKAIGDYLNRGGSLVVFADPTVQTQSASAQAGPTPPDPLADYLTSAWGISLDQDVIVDLYHSVYDGQNQQYLWPVNNGYEASPITQRLQNVATFFPIARSIRVFGTTANFPDITYTPLVKTDPRAWGEVDMQSLSAGLSSGQLQPTANAVPGPLTVGVTAENGKTKGRVVVFGDSDFASNRFANLGGAANSLLFLNSLNWGSQEESLINLTPKVPTNRTLNIVGGLTMNLIFFITVVVMPGTVLLIGIVVWALRRRQT
jgi:ABC-type uncharacterized transport system involved in gliding motility auxiliary subunit